MKSALSRSRGFLLAAMAGGLIATPWPVAAQTPASPAPAAQSAPAAQPQAVPPSWAAGRPDAAEALKLAPVVPPPIPTAADKLPLAKLKLPKNFHVELYASGVANARSLRIGDRGTVFVSTRLLDRVYAITDKNGRREVKPLVTGLYRPNGIALQTARFISPSSTKFRRSTVSRTTSAMRNQPSSMTICRATSRTAGNSSP